MRRPRREVLRLSRVSLLALLLVGCPPGDSGTGPSCAVTGVAVQPGQVTLTVGTNTTLTASVTSTNCGTPPTVTWSSAIPAAVAIQGSGTQVTIAALASSATPVTVTATAGSQSGSAQVTLTTPPAIVLGPTSLTFNAGQGGANPASQGVTITNGGGGTLTGLSIGTVTYGAGATGWLQSPGLSSTSANPSATLTVQPVTGSLAAGTYAAAIAVQAAGASNSPQMLTVSFTVSAAPVIALSASSLTFNTTQGAANPASQAITITNSGGGTLSGLSLGTISYGAGATGWLQAPALNSTTANPSATLTIQPVTGSLAAGTYTATIPILSAVASNSPQNITVTFTVAASTPVIAMSPGSLTFTATVGGADPTSQATTISNGGAGTLSGLAIGTIVYGAGASGWLQTPVLSGTTANPSVTLTVQPVTGSLAAGTYTATVPVQSGVATNSPQSLTVTFTVGAAPTIALSTASLSYSATQGSGNPASKTVTITNGGGGSLTGLAVGTITYGAGATGWLQAPTLSATTANPSVTLTVQPVTGALGAGTYTATVPVTSAVASNSPQNVTVTFTVAAAGGPLLSITPTSLSFVAAAGAGGATEPSASLIVIQNAGTGNLGTLSFGPVTYGAGASSWLGLSGLVPQSGSPPGLLFVLPSTSAVGALGPGTYTATIPVQSSTAGNSPVSATATLTVVAASTPIIRATTLTNFTAAAGGADPTAQIATISNIGGGTLSGLSVGTINYGSGASGWVQAALDVSTANPTAALTVQPVVAGLAPGTYTASIPILSGVAVNSPYSVSVSITITAAVTPQITITPSSRSFSATQGGGNPASQAVTITNGSGGTLSGLSTGTITYGAGASGWIQSASLSGTTASPSVTLTIQPATGSLTAGTYTATIPVQSAVASNSPQNVTVTFVVAAPPPAISLSSSALSFGATTGGGNPTSQVVTVTNTGGGTLSGLNLGTITYGAGASGWLQAPSLSGTTASPSVTFTVQPVTGSLAAGTYTATIPVQSTVASNSPQNVTVTFVVAAAALNYDGTWTGTTSQGQALSFVVTGNAITTLTIAYALGGNCSPTPSGSTVTFGSPQQIVNATIALSSGSGITLNGTFSSATAASGTFAITFNGLPAGCSSTASGTWNTTLSSGVPAIALSSASVSFAALAGGANPASQGVTITNSGSGTLSGLALGTITYGAGASGWIQIASLSGTTANPSVTLTIQPATGSLAAGTYTATVPVTSGAASNSPQNVTVTFTVSSAAPAIALSSTSVSFAAPVAGANPLSQAVTITNGGTGTLSGLAAGTITYGAGATGWIQSASLSGTTANPSVTLTIQPATGSLAAGTYTATVPVTSGVATNSPQNVTVTFTVSGAAPAIALAPATLSFTSAVGRTNPAAKTSTVTNGGGGTLSGLGTGTIVYGAGATAWLQAPSFNTTTANPSAILTLQPVTGSLAAGTYSATVPVQSGVAANTPQNLTVSFTVNPDPCVFANATPIAIGQTLNGTWSSATSCVITSGQFADLYVLTVASQSTLAIDLTSATDPFLSLFDFGTGTLIEEDDDDGPGLNSHIARTLPAGQYILRARPFSAGLTNTYSLSVQMVTPVPASVAINAGNAQIAAAGSAVAIAPSVVVRDVNGVAVPGATVTFATVATIGSITGAVATTDVNGIASVGSWTLATGANVLSATVTGSGIAGNPVIFSATGSSSASGFNVDLRFLTMPTLPQLQAFTGAVSRWQSIITNDLANVSLVAAANACAASSPALNEIVDDVLIQVSLTPIDGVGNVLGSAGPCLIRTTGSLPALGAMQFDVADLATLESSGQLNSVILHEMGHVLGIGSLWRVAAFNLLANPSLPSSPGVDTRFTGVNGIAGFDAIGGTTYTGGGKVPVENAQGGQGTQDSHWRESVLANELMTGFLNNGANPLSVLTVRSLQDLGYSVNTAAADAFFLTLTIVAQGSQPPPLRLLNDVRTGPIYQVDPDGRVTDLQGRAVPRQEPMPAAPEKP